MPTAGRWIGGAEQPNNPRPKDALFYDTPRGVLLFFVAFPCRDVYAQEKT